MLKLYDSAECPFCQKTRIVLAEKDLSFETIPVDLKAGEQKRPEFLKLNPFGKVPVLIDDEVIVYDSTIINEYLEDEYPHPQLMPQDSAARARVRTLEDYADNAFLVVTGQIMHELRKPEAERDEVLEVLCDLRTAGCDVLTLGQYLRPSADQLPVVRYLSPQEFDELGADARALGFAYVESGPLVRSSYHAWRHHA